MNAFPDAFTPVSVTVMEEIGPDVPETVIFDCALAAVLSGTVIAVGFEKTVDGIKNSGCVADREEYLFNSTSFALFAPNAATGLVMSEVMIIKSI